MIPFIQEPVEEYDLVSYCRRLPRLRTTQPEKNPPTPYSRRLPRLRLTAVGYPAYENRESCASMGAARCAALACLAM